MTSQLQHHHHRFVVRSIQTDFYPTACQEARVLERSSPGEIRSRRRKSSPEPQSSLSTPRTNNSGGGSAAATGGGGGLYPRPPSTPEPEFTSVSYSNPAYVTSSLPARGQQRPGRLFDDGDVTSLHHKGSSGGSSSAANMTSSTSTLNYSAASYATLNDHPTPVRYFDVANEAFNGGGGSSGVYENLTYVNDDGCCQWWRWRRRHRRQVERDAAASAHFHGGDVTTNV